MTTRPYLDPHDHAFANGPVFARPANAAAARALFARPEDGDELMAVFDAFERGAELGQGVRLGLRARLLTPDGERRARIGDNAVICVAANTAVNVTHYQGNGVNAGNNTDPDYAGNAGKGGAGVTGNVSGNSGADGRAVLIW